MSIAAEECSRTSTAPTAALVRIGLLGLGNVGRAVARLVASSFPEQTARGLTFRCVAAHVRTERPRATSSDETRITTNADEFFARPLDVVVEALGGVEPACSLVRRALDLGIPVVTANKSLVAAHGPELRALAFRRRTALRCEASVIAGVPFVGTFERRPFANRFQRLEAILNGTSNFIVSRVGEGDDFAAALLTAQRLGYAEPDPAMDVSGRDAAEKLAILLQRFGGLSVLPQNIATTSIEDLCPSDFEAAARAGGRIRPVASAAWHGASVTGFVCPAFVDGHHPLAEISGSTNGIRLTGRGSALCFTGPGAGPDVTAVTLLDDVVDVVESRRLESPEWESRDAEFGGPREGRWFLRIPIQGDADATSVVDLLASFGVLCSQVIGVAGTRYLLTFSTPESRLRPALAAASSALRTTPYAFPVVEA